MVLEWLGSYWIVAFQVLAATAVLRGEAQPRLALRILAALFLLNAAVSAVMLLPRAGGIWLHSDPGALTRLFRALDAPTGPWLLALVASLRGGSAGAWLARFFIAAGVVLAVLEFPFHEFMAFNDHYIRGVPYYVGLGLAVWVLAGGKGWERWVALALLPRALYWGTAGLLQTLSEGVGAEPALYVNRIGLLGLAVVAVAAAVRLSLRRGAPNIGISMAILAVGPLAALVETAVGRALDSPAFFRYGTVVALNLLTLGVVRPAITVLGVVPAALPGILLRSTISSVAGGVAALLISPLAGSGVASPLVVTAQFGWGLGIALVAMAIMEGVWGAAPRHARAVAAGATPEGTIAVTAPDAGPRAAAPGASVMDEPLGGDGRPQWQRILIALRGSVVANDGPTRVEARLTQKALSASTGISAARISVLTRQMNQQAERRLAAYLPDWRAAAGEGPVELIQQREGMIPGMPGVWVYYRLTASGQRLAEALLAAHPGPDTE